MFLSNHFCYIRIFLYFYWHTHTHTQTSECGYDNMQMLACLHDCAFKMVLQKCIDDRRLTLASPALDPSWYAAADSRWNFCHGFFFFLLFCHVINLATRVFLRLFFIRFFFLCPFGRIESINFAKLPPNFISLLTTSANCFSLKVIYFLMNSALFPN